VAAVKTKNWDLGANGEEDERRVSLLERDVLGTGKREGESESHSEVGESRKVPEDLKLELTSGGGREKKGKIGELISLLTKG